MQQLHHNVQLTDESRVSGYDALETVLCAAYNQAANGKGKERHAQDDPFLKQPIMEIGRLLKSIDGELYQAIKKVREGLIMARNGEADRAVREFLGAINYIAAATLLVAEQSGENVGALRMQQPQTIPVPTATEITLQAATPDDVVCRTSPSSNEIKWQDIANAYAEACEIYPHQVKPIRYDVTLAYMPPPELGEMPTVLQTVAALYFCFGDADVRWSETYAKIACAYNYLVHSGKVGGCAIRQVVSRAIDKFRDNK